ncbi:PPT2 [Bugula neritina]|uniref:palmitoyl-CoA hydrolase n=1 Tax=Bugula neritina TaxID=10212 RepID=A0A7J7JGE4_BUGNE|nr:PPT2 [Bugula neritina]
MRDLSPLNKLPKVDVYAKGLKDRIPPISNADTKVRPIIYMHGIFGKADEKNFACQYIPSVVPGAVVYALDMFNGAESALNLDYQLEYIMPAMQKIMDNHTDTGVTLLCYSQGGVICRGVVQMLSTHNVHTFITLSSPLDGQYGVTSYMSPFIPNKDRRYLWEFWYSGVGQEISIGDYWNDPHHQEAFSDPKTDVLIARLNNQTGHPNKYKKNFLKLERLVMIGGPDDTVITPWQSAQLGFYNQNETVLPFEKQPWYSSDEFGLRTLNEANKVVRHTVAGVNHIYWYRNQKVFDCCVLPYIS